MVKEETEYLDEVQVRTELDRICDLLDISPPEKIIHKELKYIYSGSKLKDNGKTIVLYRSPKLSDYTWQISVVYYDEITGRSPNPYVRNLNILEFAYVFYTVPNTIITFILLAIFVHFDYLPALASVGILQILYIAASYPLYRFRQQESLLISDACLKIGRWSEQEAADYVAQYPRGILGIGVGLSIIAILLALNIILSQL